MWLLNARSYALKFFHTAKTAPPYAILSHTWEDDEVPFKNMDDLQRAKAKSGWQKIEYTCRQALEDDLEWAWIDTCCIDKSSSAELSEAINSMFNWYQCSTVCYVYLCDLTMTATLRDEAPIVSEWLKRAKATVPFRSSISIPESYASEILWAEHETHFNRVTYQTMSAMRNDNEGYSRPCTELDILLLDTLGAFSTAKWWSRGWTLQELLAPRNVVFTDRNWQQIARLPELVVTVSTISRVDVAVLLKTAPLQSRCIAERFSWASKRSTTRKEDTAYALLGIFDANMPLLYGEGSRAFKRLQEVISLRSKDLSLYAWLTKELPGDDHLMFATCPSDFVNCVALRQRSSRLTTGSSASCTGVTFTAPISRDRDRYLIDLGCYHKSTPDLQIVLRVVPFKGRVERFHSWLRLKAPIVHPIYLTATTEMYEAFARRALSRSLTIVPYQREHVRSGFEHIFAALLTVHLPRETCLPVETAYPREFWNLYTCQFYCAQKDLAFPLTAGLDFKAPDGDAICLALRLVRGDSTHSLDFEERPLSSALVWDFPFEYQCFAELVPELALDPACTQLSPLSTRNSSLTDVATCGHSGHSQKMSRLSLGGKHLTVEVVAGEDHTIEKGTIAFDIFIRATTPTSKKDHNTGRFPWLKRRKDQSRSDNK